MNSIAILGAGDLGATLARRVAEHELARRVVLVDPDEGRAKGKALDIAQSGPVEAYDVRIEGCAKLKDVAAPDVVVVADTPDLDDPSLLVRRAGDYVSALVPEVGKGFLLVALSQAAPVVEAALGKGLPRERVLGSVPVALAAALRRRLAAELGAEAREVSLTVLGLPPDHVILPQAAACLGGVPIDRLSSTASRRALAAMKGRDPGPVALATAAFRVLQALAGARASVLPVVAFLEGEYGHRGVALMVPARVGALRLQSVVEFPLEPVERVALDTAAQRASEGAW